MAHLHELLSVDHLAAAYRRRRPLSPVEVTDYFLERIERHDPTIQALVTVTAAQARRQARAAERRLADGDPNPLLGVPVLLKDLIDVKGVPTTAGSAVRRNHIATRSAALWTRLQRSGAVLLGKANTHEFAYGGITEPTVNPWNTACLVGGSSGGPAAALAAGLAPLAIGTDTAGSIRIPANLCGVVGLKPTNGLVSVAGVVPLSPSLDVAGPMGHRPSDLAAAMVALAGERFTRGAAAAAAVRRRAASGRLRIGYLAHPGRMTPGAATAFETMLQFAGQLGRTSPVTFDGFEELVYTNFTILGVEAVVAHDEWGYPRELYTPYVRERLEQAGATRAVDFERARQSIPRHRATLDRLLDDCDVVVMPGIPYPAPRFGVTSVDVGGVSEDRDTSMCRNMGFANVTGHPVLALPVGLENGLPVGVQLVGRRGGDAELLSLGEVLSRRTSVSTVAPAYDD